MWGRGRFSHSRILRFRTSVPCTPVVLWENDSGCLLIRVMSGDTIFGKIIRREIPANIVYEDDLCLAFRDIAPQAPVHILVIPKTPIRSLADVTSDDADVLSHMLLTIKQIADQEGLAENGYRVVTNIGAEGGQTVFHLHFHLLGGRAMHWPPG